MAYTQAQLDTLNEAIASGELIVWYGDKRVEYRSLNEMLKIKDLMESDIAAKQNKPKKTRFYFSTSKGTE